MLNKICLMGRLTKSPELRTTASGKNVANYSLAVDRDFSKEKETDFFDIVSWEKQADFVVKHFAKGQLVCVEGRLQRRIWTDDSQQKRYAYEVVTNSVYFAEGKRKEEPADAGEAYTTQEEYITPPAYASEDDDLPFDPFAA